jgi:hypothetical protein
MNIIITSVVQWSEITAADPEVSGSIPSSTIICEKQWIRIVIQSDSRR